MVQMIAFLLLRALESSIRCSRRRREKKISQWVSQKRLDQLQLWVDMKAFTEDRTKWAQYNMQEVRELVMNQVYTICAMLKVHLEQNRRAEISLTFPICAMKVVIMRSYSLRTKLKWWTAKRVLHQRKTTNQLLYRQHLEILWPLFWYRRL